MLLIVIGIAGSGKSTQSQLVSRHKGWAWLSVGQLIRDNTQGDLVKVVNSGKLLEDGIVEDLLLKSLRANPSNKIILDGFPRRPSQAEWLINSLNKLNIKIGAIIHLNAHSNVVLDRLVKRGRQDDVPAAIKERFQEYEEDIKPVIDIMLKKKIPILEINAEQEPKDVHSEIGLKLRTLDIEL